MAGSGIPMLPGGVEVAAAAIVILTGDAIPLPGSQVGSPWGIYLNGVPVVLADTVTALDYRKDSLLSTYPIEGGKFETYNKVAQPFDARVRFVAGGSLANRTAFLASIEAIVDDYKLYDVVTPEIVYSSCNVKHHSYHRTSANGLGLMEVDVWLDQIRVSTAQTGGGTASASGADQTNGGAVQPVVPSSGQAAAATGFN